MSGCYATLQLCQYKQKYESVQKQVSKLQEMLAEVSGDKAVLENRFHTLAENHEQMIRIKDEFKEANYRLSREQKEETMTVEQLQEELKRTKKSRDDLEKKCQCLECHVHRLESEREAEKIAHQLKIEELNCVHSDEIAILQRNLEREYSFPVM